jgi:hypothetical protein
MKSLQVTSNTVYLSSTPSGLARSPSGPMASNSVWSTYVSPRSPKSSLPYIFDLIRTYAIDQSLDRRSTSNVPIPPKRRFIPFTTMMHTTTKCRHSLIRLRRGTTRSCLHTRMVSVVEFPKVSCSLKMS